MSKRIRDLPKVWFGCHRRETERIFRKLDALQNRVADELERQVRQERIRHEELKMKLAQLADDRQTQQQDDWPEEANDRLFQERLTRSVQVVIRQGEAEVHELERIIAKKKADHAERLRAIDKQLVEYEAAIERLVEEAAEVLDALGEAREETIAVPADDTVSRIMASLSVEAGRILPTNPAPEQADMTEQAAESGLGHVAAQTLRHAKVIELRLRSMLNSMEGVKAGGSVGAAAADGSLSVSNSAAAKRWADKMARAAMQRPSSSGGGQVDLYLTDVRDPELLAYWKDDPALQHKPLSLMDIALWEDEAAGQDPSTAPEQREDTVMPKADPSHRTAKDAAYAMPQAIEKDAAAMPSAAAHAKTDPASPALSEEIRQIQLRYIVGMIAGESVYAPDGRLIAAKGRPITEEAVQAAKQFGKLPELIVHMKIPALGANER